MALEAQPKKKKKKGLNSVKSSSQKCEAQVF